MVLSDELVYLEKGDWPKHRNFKRRVSEQMKWEKKSDKRRCGTPLAIKLLGWTFLALSVGLLLVGVYGPPSGQTVQLPSRQGLEDMWDAIVDSVESTAGSVQNADSEDLCPQRPALKLEGANFTIPEPSIALQASRLGGAVQVDTSVQDEYPPFNDNPELWKSIFDPLADYLERTFPLIHAPDGPVTREKVGGVGLLYTWPGSDKTLKPLVLAAHQDVVPVDPQTVDQWTHPPFSGYFDEETGLVWGRGAADDKTGIISTITAIESLLAARDQDGNAWVPKRTIVLSYGADEEASGRVAGDLAKHLVEVYGENGAFMLVDEGGPVISAEDSPFQRALAVVATAEKGYLDARITVHAPGGHSSMPPAHTAIGHLAHLITLVEANPYSERLGVDNPAVQMLACLTTAKGSDPKLKKAILKLKKILKDKKSDSRKSQKKIEKLKKTILELSPPDIRESFVTSQAVDLISGGVKINALPEEATTVVNHRIEVTSSVGEVREHIAKALRPYAEKNNIELDAWGNKTLSFSPKSEPELVGLQESSAISTPGSFLDQQSPLYIHATQKRSWSYLRNSTRVPDVTPKAKPATRIVLSDAFDSALEPAPQTPLEGEGSEPWKILQEVIRASYEEEDILVVPDLMGGNTDTKSYWNLTSAIFRFSPGSPKPAPDNLAEGIHTVNEWAPAEGLVYGWRLWINLIRAVAE
ncbi:hypothetical protein OC846_001382 [Tilletia horrida]|uniref:Peptidase M20 dimerisation domain-containing protein n=1 Tax=Tilletia horrida TaxID=155126 RepID=A0AAN6GTY5_9BASI|nr:hypothetical protein OC845_004491 [Tilletia horrida]KAK0556163.1 hypothetical protein OC846_001382 [Tilletia horrida]KAK0569089.1 hypothetical protein OC861_001331 [Tilletia horrida]